jgi:hypothetical protein
MSRKSNERRDRKAELSELEPDPVQSPSEGAGQSGDTQGLPEASEAAPESVEELAEEDQAFEAGVVEGVEEAGDHPGRPVRSHEDPRPRHESEVPPDPDWR